MYIIYTNKIPYLHKFLTDNKFNVHYNKITNNKYTKTFEKCKNLQFDHLTINYIDDSTNLISDTSSINLINYLTLYYNLLQHYYDSNKLVINPDKTELLVSCKKKFREEVDKIKFKADVYNIEQKIQQKILVLQLTTI